MIEPYESVIKAEYPKIERLGFNKVSDSEYSSLFSDGSSLLQFVTELQYPSISLNLIDKSGKARAVHLIQRILVPDLARSDQNEFKRLRVEYQIDSTPINETMTDGRLFKYTRFLVDTLLNFLISHRSEVLDSPTYKQRYDEDQARFLESLSRPINRR